MNAKKILLQYADLIKKAERYRERINTIEDTLKGINLDGLPRGTTPGDPTKNAALNLALLKEQLQAAEIEAQTKAQQIEAAIEQMKTPKYKELLHSRYIMRLSWPKVAQRLDTFRPGREYEVKHVSGYMLGQALREFEEVLK